jgi:hypothetical protein
MATETLYPNSVQTPSIGGGSCSGSDTARNCYAVSNCGDGLVKETADHHNFTSPSYQTYWSSASLKIYWDKDGQPSGSRDCVNYTGRGEYRLKYTTNNSTYYDCSGFPKAGENLNKTGNVTIGLSTSQDISKVRVRINCQAEAPACPTGACCTGVNYCSCSIQTEAACGGYYLGDSTTCSGACDFPACGGGDPFPPPE